MSVHPSPPPPTPRCAAPARAPGTARTGTAFTAITAAALLALSALPARAQALQPLYGVARSYDASYLAAQLGADAAEHKATQSRALSRPSLSATAGSSYGRSDTPWSTTTQTTSLQHSVGLSAQVTLYNRAIDATQAQAELQVAQARAQLQAAEQDLILRVTQAYFEVLASADALGTVQQGKRAIQEQVAAARKGFQVGSTTITDTREAEARLDLARAQELAAENDLLTARLALDQLVGRRNLAPKPLAKPVQLPALAPEDVEEWVRVADAQHPGLRQLRTARELARLETEKARAAGLPTVVGNASVQWIQGRLDGQTKASDGSTQAFGPGKGAGPSTSVGLQLNLPLYAGGAIEGRQRETLTLEQKAEAELEAARRGVAQAVRTAYYGVQSLRARVGALEAAEASSQLALESIQTGWRLGVRVNLDVLNAQTQAQQAQRELARARYDLLVGLMRLRQQAGVLQPQDVAGLNALLVR